MCSEVSLDFAACESCFCRARGVQHYHYFRIYVGGWGPAVWDSLLCWMQPYLLERQAAAASAACLRGVDVHHLLSLFQPPSAAVLRILV